MSKMIKVETFWVDLDKVRYVIEHPNAYEFVYDGGENQDTIYFNKNSLNILEVINQMNYNT
jgi:hypothetical protein